MGDDILLWAVFERADQPVSERITPEPVFHRVTEDTNELSEAMSMLRLHWHRD
ncbi:hypothetical protein [Microbacterium sp. Marseille-Q6648]|uniref:hypothetical protein n=1 Tax=Microbacterium sp. Marseille-Q6648 TaxID=2937991 RepID=UPI00203B88E2|nr:hypothetical protein [Microbacterium sp. Marseille-Q6648]